MQDFHFMQIYIKYNEFKYDSYWWCAFIMNDDGFYWTTVDVMFQIVY